MRKYRVDIYKSDDWFVIVNRMYINSESEENLRKQISEEYPLPDYVYEINTIK